MKDFVITIVAMAGMALGWWLGRTIGYSEGEMNQATEIIRVRTDTIRVPIDSVYLPTHGSCFCNRQCNTAK
jgi:hypothetical protein